MLRAFARSGADPVAQTYGGQLERVDDHQRERYLQVTAQSAQKAVTLTAYAPGKEPILPHLPGGIPARRIPAASINGHPSYWIFKPDAAGQATFELRWKHAENSWADLEGDGLRGTDAELTRMAYWTTAPVN